jgi:hypothetical protein
MYHLLFRVTVANNHFRRAIRLFALDAIGRASLADISISNFFRTPIDQPTNSSDGTPGKQYLLI